MTSIASLLPLALVLGVAAVMWRLRAQRDSARRGAARLEIHVLQAMDAYEASEKHRASLSEKYDSCYEAYRTVYTAYEAMLAENRRLTRETAAGAQAQPVPAADSTELATLRAEVKRLRADLAASREEPSPGASFKGAKKKFAAMFHPDAVSDSDPDKDARTVAFKLFWPVLEKMARSG